MAGKHGVFASNYAVTKAFAQMTGVALGVARRDAWAAMNKDLNAANWDTLSYYRERMRNAGDISPENADLVSDMLDRTNLANHSRTARCAAWPGRSGLHDTA